MPLVLGRVSGRRGGHGEVTVRVASGNAARWTGVSHVTLRAQDPGAPAAPHAVEAARAYRDRLVLKLSGIDCASDAARLRGCEVAASGEDVPGLPDGVYWIERLVGSRVEDASRGEIGRVTDVMETGGVDLLVVTDNRGGETLVPLAREFVTSVDPDAARIGVRLPDDLLTLNADGAGGVA
jgi:16S rRNA processing protein RimM